MITPMVLKHAIATSCALRQAGHQLSLPNAPIKFQPGPNAMVLALQTWTCPP